MKKFFKKMVTGVLTASMMLSAVGVSYATPVWDDETDTANLPFSSDITGKTTVDIGFGEMTVYILPEDGNFWFDSSESKLSKEDIENVHLQVLLFKADGYNEQVGDIPAEFDKKYNFFTGSSLLPWAELDDLESNPHIFNVAAIHSDGSSIGINYSYYQGFDNVEALNSSDSKTAETSWKSDGKGWWVERSDGSYLTDEWYESDGCWYYLGSDGYMVTDTTTPDGYTVNSDGVWNQVKAWDQYTSSTFSWEEIEDTPYMIVLPENVNFYMEPREDAEIAFVGGFEENYFLISHTEDELWYGISSSDDGSDIRYFVKASDIPFVSIVH